MARKSEIKLFVRAANVPQAIKALKLDEHRAVNQLCCFFDTSDGTLEAKHLILRARQKGDGPGESTVKLRASGDTELSDAERAIQPEQDWTDENQSTLSRSVDHSSLAAGMVAKAAAGKLAVAGLFNQEQRDLVMARMQDFKWESLRCYGPVETRVWRRQWKLHGFPEKVTVELWLLRKDGKHLELLEVSAKTKATTEEQSRTMAKQFYAAAKASGMGEPSGLTKTRMVLDFFKPGRP